MKNHLGKYECKLCLTLHNNEGSYLAHTQGKRHQDNLYVCGHAVLSCFILLCLVFCAWYLFFIHILVSVICRRIRAIKEAKDTPLMKPVCACACVCACVCV